MKKIIIGLILTLSLGLVGCTYKVKDEATYKEGEAYLQLDDTKVSHYSKQLSYEISILDGNKMVEKFKSDDKKKKYNDFKYGMLDSTVKSLNNKKEKGIEAVLVKNTTDVMELDELNKKQKELYSEDYNKIIDEYIAVFNEIYENYNGDNIDKSYKEKVKNINEKYDSLTNKIVEQFSNEVVKWAQDQLPKKYTVKGTGTIKFK